MPFAARRFIARPDTHDAGEIGNDDQLISERQPHLCSYFCNTKKATWAPAELVDDFR
jgi:hypothetical protein